MKARYFLLLTCLLVGAGSCHRARQVVKNESVLPDKPALLAPQTVPLGVGTVVASRSYRLVPASRGPVRYLFVSAGQRVRKGDLLVKFEDRTFLLAPTAGLITEQQPADSTALSGALPELWFNETASFSLRLPPTREVLALCLGQQVWVRNKLNPVQLVMGKVHSVVVDSSSLLLSLRLQSVETTLIPVGAQVQAEAVLPLVL